MRELGVDLSGRTAHRLARDDMEWADVVVTMGCAASAPTSGGA